MYPATSITTMYNTFADLYEYTSLRHILIWFACRSWGALNCKKRKIFSKTHVKVGLHTAVVKKKQNNQIIMFSVVKLIKEHYKEAGGVGKSCRRHEKQLCCFSAYNTSFFAKPNEVRDEVALRVRANRWGGGGNNRPPDQPTSFPTNQLRCFATFFLAFTKKKKSFAASLTPPATFLNASGIFSFIMMSLVTND